MHNRQTIHNKNFFLHESFTEETRETANKSFQIKIVLLITYYTAALG